MADDTEIERMLEEKMEADEQASKQHNGDKKENENGADKDKEKKHKKHKHHKHKSHKSDRKHERKRSRSPRRSRSPIGDRRRRTPTPPPLSSGKRRDVNSELHQLAQTISRQKSSKDTPSSSSSSKPNRREKSPELTPEERDLRTVLCKYRCRANRRDHAHVRL